MAKSARHLINGAIKRSILIFYPDAFPQKGTQKPDDPEMLVLYPFCKGLGIDVGCGSRKTHPSALGVDLTLKGDVGKYGSERRQISEADIVASGDKLSMFADNSLDYVLARHNLEHYDNPIKTLKEWKRVLKKGGILGVVLPDSDSLDTMRLDPTHKYPFTKRNYQTMLAKVGGFKILEIKTCIKDWSFSCIAKKIK